MANGAFGITPFSSAIDMWLESDRVRVPLSEVGTGFVAALKPINLPKETNAVLVIVVDGRRHHRRLLLVHGMNESDTETMTVPVDDAAPF